MSKLEVKRMEVEILRVQAASSEMELKIDERFEEIERLKSHILIQEARVIELIQKIKEMKEADGATK